MFRIQSLPDFRSFVGFGRASPLLLPSLSSCSSIKARAGIFFSPRGVIARLDTKSSFGWRDPSGETSFAPFPFVVGLQFAVPSCTRPLCLGGRWGFPLRRIGPWCVYGISLFPCSLFDDFYGKFLCPRTASFFPMPCKLFLPSRAILDSFSLIPLFLFIRGKFFFRGAL